MGGFAGAIGDVTDSIQESVMRMGDGLDRRGPVRGKDYRFPQELPARGILMCASRLPLVDSRAIANQPLRDPETGAVVAHNGEIYNFRELRRELGVAMRTESDTEVVLQAYLRWGIQCFERFDGMYSIAIFDAKRRKLILARDRLGYKPLYFGERHSAESGPLLVFASEVRSFLDSDLFERRLDPSSVAAFAWNGFARSPGTLLKGVQSIMPGTLLQIDLDSMQSVLHQHRSLPSRSINAGSNAEPLVEALKNGVARQMASDQPVGFFLSGGIDSSAVVSLASQISNDPIQTFNIAFEESEFDESPYARRVAEALHTQHHEIKLSSEFFKGNLGAALSSLDQPSFDALNTYMVSKAVRDAGLSIALGGTGGDDLFGGNRTFFDIPRAAKWGKAATIVPRPILQQLAPAISRLKQGKAGLVPHQTGWAKLTDVLLARGGLLETYQISYALFTSDFLGQVTTVSLDSTPYGMLSDRLEEARSMLSSDSLLYNIALLELSIFASERLLRDIDAVSMNVGLEVRAPLLDDTLLDAWAHVDDETAFLPLGKKQTLRDAAMPNLDPQLFERPKAGFVLPLDRWCREGLKDQIDAVFANKALCESAGLSSQTCGQLWQSFQRGDPGLYWSRVWALYVYLDWCNRHKMTL